MYLFVICLCILGACADRLENTYLPPQSARTAGGSGSFLNAPRPSGGAAQSYSGPSSPPVAIVRQSNENPGDGSYRFDFETENHISQQETGQVRAVGNEETVAVQGSYSYTGDDGQVYTVNYVADENGFRPEGAHLPVAPAVPAEIQRALEQNAADEAAGIVDDGQYKEEPQRGPSGAGSGAFSAAGSGAFSGAGSGSGGYSGAGNGGATNRQYLAPQQNSNRQQQGYRY